MAKPLKSEQRATLRQFLQEKFSFSELKNLTFDLNIDFESLPHSTKDEFSRELISYCERRNALNCLIEKIVAQRQSDNLVTILARLPACKASPKVQLILREPLPPDLKSALDNLIKLGGERIEVIGAISGSLRVLLGLPDPEPTLWNQSELNPVNFLELDALSQIVWRTICVYLPITKHELFESEVHWSDVVLVIQQSQPALLHAKRSLTAPASYNYYAGLVLMRLRRWDAALRSFAESIALGLDFGSLRFYSGMAYEQLSGNKLATKEYDLAIEQDRSLTAAYLTRGALAVGNNYLMKALNDFETAIALNPKLAIAYLNKAGVLYRLQRYEQAREIYTQGISLDPTDTRLYYGRGLTLTKLREDNRALSDFSKVLELDPENTRAYMARGKLLLWMKRLTNALHDFRIAASLGDTRAGSYIDKLEEEVASSKFSQLLELWEYRNRRQN